MSGAKSGASLYILTMLLQRLEKTNPGLINDMIEGVKSDRAAITSDIPQHIEDVFEETLSTLEKAQQSR